MPLGGLRSSIEGTLHDDSAFPDTDNLRQNRIVNMAGDDDLETSVATNLAEIWSENPAVGTFNPGTKEGATIFKLKTKNEHEKKIELVKGNAQLFRRLIQAKEPSFGGIISRVPTEFDATGNITKHSNLIQEYSTIKLETLQRNAFERFGTALAPGAAIPNPPFQKRALNPATNDDDKVTFYSCVDSQVVATWIKETFTSTCLKGWTTSSIPTIV